MTRTFDYDTSGLVTQYDKNDVESAGLVKFDFLGLRTLTIIDWALKMIQPKRKRLGEEPLGGRLQAPLGQPEAQGVRPPAHRP